VPEDDLDPILIQVTVPLPVPMIYAALTTPDQLAGWLCRSARVAPRVGGEYALRFEEPVPFESAGTVRQWTADVDVGFTWFAPPEFATLMNSESTLTNVYIRLQESPEGVDITLEHAGWRSGDAWEDARSWHFHFWDERLQRLKDYLIKTAYG
jgi:uncharacterized protein YndB with AHSA1/START domain